MKPAIPVILYCLFIAGCNNKKNNINNADITKPANFFPVTSYIKGQITEIKEKGITPLKKIKINDHVDSAWLKIEDLEKEMEEFLTPVIDTNNLTNYFEETKFNDQTINAFTFTYNPIKKLPDSLYLNHWDVYVDPDKNTIRKIYMVKKYPDKIVQLTWYSNRYCLIVTIQENEKGISIVLKEEKITWEF
ncbi:MAG: hypothetical protein IPJ81_02135 [Chitinophagaceae bacterium]|nr:hypothetical protein [Chitinophagaceae bacterium]